MPGAIALELSTIRDLHAWCPLAGEETRPDRIVSNGPTRTRHPELVSGSIAQASPATQCRGWSAALMARFNRHGGRS